MTSSELKGILCQRRDRAIRAVSSKVQSLTNRYQSIEVKLQSLRQELKLRAASDKVTLETLDTYLTQIHSFKESFATVVVALQIEERLLAIEEAELKKGDK